MAKEEEEGAKKLSSKKDVPSLSATTLFVRNLPFIFDSKELEKVFSDVGPVKRCFVVKDTGLFSCFASLKSGISQLNSFPVHPSPIFLINHR